MDIKPNFEFLKAVEPKLISVPDIPSWNYRILKHQTGQEPMYVRAYTFFDVGLCNRIQDCLKSSSVTKYEDENEDEEYCRSSMFNEENATQAPSAVIMNAESANQTTNYDILEGKDSKGSYDLSSSQSRRAAVASQSNCGTSTDRQCPICLFYFPAHIIQSHSNDCIDARMNPETELYNDLMFEEEVLCDVESDATLEVEAVLQQIP